MKNSKIKKIKMDFKVFFANILDYVKKQILCKKIFFLNKFESQKKREFQMVLLLLLLGFFGLWGGDYQAVADTEMIRVHIFADCNTPHAQNVKLMVRDAVMEYMLPFTSAAESFGEEEEIVKSRLSEINRIAEGVANQYGYSAKTEYGRFYFSQRKKGECTMPAGYYNALKITLGRGEGHNWFCVLYPDLALKKYTGHLRFDKHIEGDENDFSEQKDNAETEKTAKEHSDGQINVKIGSFFWELIR